MTLKLWGVTKIATNMNLIKDSLRRAYLGMNDADGLVARCVEEIELGKRFDIWGAEREDGKPVLIVTARIVNSPLLNERIFYICTIAALEPLSAEDWKTVDESIYERAKAAKCHVIESDIHNPKMVAIVVDAGYKLASVKARKEVVYG